MRLLIHHHAPAFVDEQGIHVQSFIGHWVNALSPHLEQIGLLLPVTSVQSAYQDTLICEPNVQLHALPMGGRRWDYFERKRRIGAICREVSKNYDVLLVRGLTPRQWTIWRHCDVQKKAFLLVGSLLENRPKFGWAPDALLTWALSFIRRQEFNRISKTGILLANSPQLVYEISAVSGSAAQFVSTNTLQKNQIPPLERKEIGHPCQLLFCGRVVPDKGIEELIAALGMLQKQGTYQLWVLGNLAPTYKARLESLAAQWNVENDIYWEGFVPFGPKLLAYYQRADFMVLPSYHEGFPHSIWEAAAFSVPVLTTKVGGIPGLVDDSMVQFIEKKSARDIAEKISWLAHQPSLRWEKVERLYQHGLGFTVEAGAKSLVDVLFTAM